MKFQSSKKTVLNLVLLAAFGGGIIADAMAFQGAGARSSRGDRGASKKPEVRYPDATREEPKAKASNMQNKLGKLFKAYEKDDNEAEALALANELLADPKASNHDKAIAAQVGAQAAYGLDDTATTKRMLQQVIALNALDNNNHYQSMLMLAQLQLQDDELQAGVATLDQYLEETRSKKPEDLLQKGQALYQMEKYPEAIEVIKQAIAASSEPKDSWYNLLMASYAEAEQFGEAVKVAEQMANKNPADKRAQLNLISVYQQADQFDKAAVTLEKMRAAGQLTEEKEYRQLYVTYANMEGKEKEVISVVNEGLQKGILKADDYQNQLALAQAYYYSEQIPQAIEAWRKAAPLAPTGDTYLNLARVLWQEDRIPEAKQAARAALDKGIKNPQDAKKIIALP
ncbi:heme biosynthesis protein HemY [Pseudoxanthomonas mexicana]|uniref:heme biosynthesis protein HemY n=1 Tax=Pseudoxanthomonas mexicana TaxID=128785 RepID=UPI00398A62C9